MKRLILFLSVFAVIVTLVANRCSNNPAGPTEQPPKDLRRLSWTVDTLAYPGSLQTLMTDMWGSSATDVYVCGDNERGYGKMYHYDGVSWTPVSISGAASLDDIYGFSADDIWAVGDSLTFNPNPKIRYAHHAVVMHFDGSKWRHVKKPEGEPLFAVGGTSSSNLFTGGWEGYLAHYDGTFWQPDSVPIAAPKEGHSEVLAIAGNPGFNDIYMVFTVGGTGNHYLLKHSSAGWKVVKDMRNDDMNNLWYSPWGTLYGTGGFVQKWSGTDWEEVLYIQTFLSFSIYGTDANNLFIVGHAGTSLTGGRYGEVIHYNGEDWYEYKELQFPGIEYKDVWTDGNEVFVVGWYTDSFPNITLVLHGK